jgi:hypothetical protein
MGRDAWYSWVPRNRDVHPSLEEVLELRRDRMFTVRQVIGA